MAEWPLIKDFVSAMLEAIEPLPGDEVFQLSSWNSSRKRLIPKTYSTIGLTKQQRCIFTIRLICRLE